MAVGLALLLTTGGVPGVCVLEGAGAEAAGDGVGALALAAGTAEAVVGVEATATVVVGGVLAATGDDAAWLRFSGPMLPSKVNWGGLLLTLGSTCKALA